MSKELVEELRRLEVKVQEEIGTISRCAHLDKVNWLLDHQAEIISALEAADAACDAWFNPPLSEQAITGHIHDCENKKHSLDLGHLCRCGYRWTAESIAMPFTGVLRENALQSERDRLQERVRELEIRMVDLLYIQALKTTEEVRRRLFECEKIPAELWEMRFK